MNKKAKKTNFGMILLLIVVVGAGYYFFVMDNGSHNPFNVSTNSSTGTNKALNCTSTGGTYFASGDYCVCPAGKVTNLYDTCFTPSSDINSRCASIGTNGWTCSIVNSGSNFQTCDCVKSGSSYSPTHFSLDFDENYCKCSNNCCICDPGKNLLFINAYISKC